MKRTYKCSLFVILGLSWGTMVPSFALQSVDLSANQVCDLLQRIENNSASDEDNANYQKIVNEYKDNKAKSTGDRIFWVRRNNLCPNQEYASNTYAAYKYPCRDNPEYNLNKFCYQPHGEFDRAMIQEYGRAMWKNNFDNTQVALESNIHGNIVRQNNLTNDARAIYYTINSGDENGKRIYGQIITKLNPGAFTTLKKAELYCQFVTTKSVFDNSPVFKGDYECSGSDMDKQKCDIYNAILAEIQVSPNDSTRIGAYAEWKPLSTSTQTENAGTVRYGCIATIPQ